MTEQLYGHSIARRVLPRDVTYICQDCGMSSGYIQAFDQHPCPPR